MWQASLLLNTGISGMWQTKDLSFKCKHSLGPERNHLVEGWRGRERTFNFFSVWFKKKSCCYFEWSLLTKRATVDKCDEVYFAICCCFRLANFNVLKATIYHIYSKTVKRGIYVVSVCKRQACLTRSWLDSKAHSWSKHILQRMQRMILLKNQLQKQTSKHSFISHMAALK